MEGGSGGSGGGGGAEEKAFFLPVVRWGRGGGEGWHSSGSQILPHHMT